jgi:extradiol dioxygenase family protein
MSPVTGLHVSVPVLDLADAVRFYTEVFDLTVFGTGDELCQLGINGHRISIRKTAARSSSIQRDGTTGIRARHFGFRVASREDVDRCRARVVAAGGAIVTEPAERDDGYTCFCCDPSGNQVEIYYSIHDY